MSNIAKRLNQPIYKGILDMSRIAGELAKKENIKAYIVGGVVRDLILKKNVQDLDLMIEGDGILFARKLANIIGVKKIVPFEKFGTALIPNKMFNIEIASSRIEQYKKNSRSPSKIKFTSLEEDLKRRDFTINAMAMDIHPDSFGDIFDPFEGEADLKKGLLKTPLQPDKTFSDDPLRMMRAAYFSSKLNLKIDSKCRNSIIRKAERIKIVSWERIRDEFIKILNTPKPSVGLVILQKTGLMKRIFPEIDIMYDMKQSPEWHHKDIFAHTLQVVDNAAKLTKKMEIRFAALVHDIAKPRTRKIDPKKGYTFHGHDAIGEKMMHKVSKRMKLSNQLSNYLKKLTLLHLRPIALVKSEVTDSAVRRLMVSAGEELEDLMILCRADITTKNPKLVNKYLNNFDIVEQKMKLVLDKDSAIKFQSPVRGKEIMKIFGLEEGKEIGNIKRFIEEAILDGDIENTYEAAKRYLMTYKKI
ncbi:MAG: tRNA nucleotidyltransferase [Candidatus Marinimicrobia bacterium]|nr:tRNA nucleotidyltransferase [Candidatus Neomarinimicrobiota bacterium]|tara:strand:+ start:232 stop:1647 length:1416 start_codon:yes stop_codon:yes gene_type:complete